MHFQRSLVAALRRDDDAIETARHLDLLRHLDPQGEIFKLCKSKDLSSLRSVEMTKQIEMTEQ